MHQKTSEETCLSKQPLFCVADNSLLVGERGVCLMDALNVKPFQTALHSDKSDIV